MESTTMTESIGSIGLGLVGSVLAELLQARGIRVVGCDIDPSKKAAHMARGGESIGPLMDIQVEKILRHLDLWEGPADRTRPATTARIRVHPGTVL